MTDERSRTIAAEAAELRDQALDWQVRLHAGSGEAGLGRAYRAWRESSPGHRAAAEQAEQLWRELGEVPRPADVPKVEALPARPGAPRHRGWSRRAVAGGALAAGLALAVAGGSGALGPLSAFYADHATGVGERKSVALPDGSTLHLDAASSLSLSFGPGERRILLHEGRAVFEVAPDAARPFVVEVAGGSARALGTVFQVARHAEGASVAVVEGLVEVRPPRGEAARLTVGEVARYASDRPLRVRRLAEAEAPTAWRRGKLIVEREPLGEVIEAVARYRRTPILVLDERAGSLEVSGVFELADVEALLEAVEEGLPVTVYRLPFVTVIR